jgi:hypothetical protein
MVITNHLKNPVKTRLLGLIRDLTSNNAPLILALETLFQKATLTETQKAAIEESLLILFGYLIYSSKGIPQNFNKKAIFEYTRTIFVAMIKYVEGLVSAPDIWNEREHFDFFDHNCNVTFSLIIKPCYLILDNKSIVIANKPVILDKINKKEMINGIANPSLQNVKTDEKLETYYKIMKNVNLFSVWTPKTQALFKPTNESLGFKLHNDWNKYDDQWNGSIYFKIYKPMELKENPPFPVLTKNSSNQLVIYSGLASCPRNISSSLLFFDVMKGEEENDNADELAYNIVSKANVLHIPDAVITREPDEAIVVIFDKSGSMCGRYFNSNELQRIGAVQAFFSSFADRIMAYNFHHVISLLLFDHFLE